MNFYNRDGSASQTSLPKDIAFEQTLSRLDELEWKAITEELPQGFSYDLDGWLLYQGVGGDSEKEAPLRICKRIGIFARTRNNEGLNHGKLICIWDQDSRKHYWPMPMRLLAADFKEVLSELLDRGLEISASPKAKHKLNEYLLRCKPVKNYRCIEQTGWVGRMFVLPGQTFGHTGDEQVLFQHDIQPVRKFEKMGTIEDFQKISELCVKNNLMIFSLGLAFAAPLLFPMGIENFGYNFVGESSTGKTCILNLANSVNGPSTNIQQWRVTLNGLEGLASDYNDSLFCLDELGQVDPQTLANSLYMLGNGRAKARSNRMGTTRAPKSWRTILLSTGEIPIEEHLAILNLRSKAGQEVRLIDLYVSNQRYGCFQELHGFENGSKFAKHLSEAASKTYGVAGYEFMNRLVENYDQAINLIKDSLKDFIEAHSNSTDSGQIHRVLQKFALVSAAGELATQWGITGWPFGTAARACSELFQLWVSQRGGKQNLEETQIRDHISLFFERNWTSKFLNIYEGISKKEPNDCAGFRMETKEGWEFFMFPTYFKKELCKGFQREQVIKTCVQLGWLDPNLCKPYRVPRINKVMRLYRFSSLVLGCESDTGALHENIKLGEELYASTSP